MKNSKKISVAALLVVVILIVVTLSDYFIASNSRKWDEGKVKINGITIELPMSVDDFENKTGLTVDNEKNTSGFLSVEGMDLKYGQLDLFCKDNVISGMRVSGKDQLKDYDEYPGKTILFPEDVNTNMSVEDIEKSYKTGIFDFFLKKSESEVSEDPGNSVTYKTVTEKYTGKNYDLSVTQETHKSVTSDNMVTTVEIFYYVADN